MALFNEITEEELLEEALSNAPSDIDTRQGSIFYDAIAACVLQIARLFNDANILAEQSSVMTATGEFLDMLANNLYLNKLSREKAVTAQYSVNVTCDDGLGIDSLDIEENDRFFDENSGLYFLMKFDYTEEGDISSYYVEAEQAGTDYNDLLSGTQLIPVETIEFLSSITIGNLIRAGVDEEDDEQFRSRIQQLLSAPAENANEQQYKTWCEQIEGVGTATIYPLFAGPNTVKAVLTNSNNQPCEPEVVKAVQEFIDPITMNTKVTFEGEVYTVGDGIGGGIAPLGAHFLAVSAGSELLTVSIVNIVLVEGIDEEKVKEQISIAIKAYFNELVDNYNAKVQITVKLIDIISIIAAIDTVDDFVTIKINGETENYIVATGNIPAVDIDHIVFEEVSDG